MDDDLNTSQALASIYSLIRDAKKRGEDTSEDILEVDEKILGLDLDREEIIPKNVQKLANEREKARKEKNWAESDKIRDEIQKLGYIVEDTEKGSQIKKI